MAYDPGAISRWAQSLIPPQPRTGDMREMVDTLETHGIAGIPICNYEVIALKREVASLQALLDGRDKFIVQTGAWPTFVEGLPKVAKPSCTRSPAKPLFERLRT